MNNSRDHPVFRRLSRQQLVVRRRSLGLQPLVLDPAFASSRKTRCKHCGRRFNPVWKSYLCHLCGRWVCEPCSSVVEREKELLRVRFVRCCVTCTKMLNKLPEPDVLLPYLAVPYVTASSHSQIGLHLADALRTNKDLRPSVLQLLNCLGRPLGTNTQILADIREEDWAAANALVPTNVSLEPSGRTKSGSHRRREKHRNGDSGAKPGNPEWVQFVVQQCFEVSLPELSLEECVVSEADGTRRYPIFYDEETDVPFAPTCSNEAARDECMTRCNLLGRGIAEQKEVQLICHLAAKEFDAPCATVTALHADKQYALAPVNRSSICVSTERAKSFCAHAMVSGLPFLVRNTMLDVRFRTFACVRGDTEGTANRVLFYFGFPIVATHSGTVIAMLCVMDSKPRKSITTMQYSVMKKLTEILSTFWTG
ncbi:FYVE finger-containing protein [Phytophthora cinnamomi]|uniref:FYVE finger-containing protein n=1 Tax=Phytophthora cinnamomi TaxID=4785 RepID=UPI00355A1EFB|nr:FYVE finger-containing protein [Phytophthora cinnamomi]